MKKENVLLVDGYNVIGAWEKLRQIQGDQLEEARNKLIGQMAEYQAYYGYRVIVVFDAYLSKGIEAKVRRHGVEVIFTRENETADERIEKLVTQLKKRSVQIHVATSDLTEQWIIFAQGALRKSARELHLEINEMGSSLTKEIEAYETKKPSNKFNMSEETREALERMRRGL